MVSERITKTKKKPTLIQHWFGGGGSTKKVTGNLKLSIDEGGWQDMSFCSIDEKGKWKSEVKYWRRRLARNEFLFMFCYSVQQMQPHICRNSVYVVALNVVHSCYSLSSACMTRIFFQYTAFVYLISVSNTSYIQGYIQGISRSYPGLHPGHIQVW